MEWKDRYLADDMPAMEDIGKFVDSPLLEKLQIYLQETYSSTPQLEYSRCDGQRGWNIKYKKGSKALCTIYPMEGYFITLVSIAPKAEVELELLLPSLSAYLNELYKRTRALPRMGRWLMIEVKDEQVLKDTIRLINLRVSPPQK